MEISLDDVVIEGGVSVEMPQMEETGLTLDDVEVSTASEVRDVRQQLAKKEVDLIDRSQGKDIIGTPQEGGFIKVEDIASQIEQIQETRANVDEQSAAQGLTFDQDEPGAEPTLAVLDMIPALGAGLAVGAKAYKFMRPIAGKQMKIVKEWADKDPKLATDILDAVHFAKKHKIDIPAELWTKEGSMIKTGNTLLDTKLTNMKDKYKGIEYDTMNNMINSIHKSPVSVDEAALAWRESMDSAYKKYNADAINKWNKFNEMTDINMELSKGGQKRLMSQIDEATKGAPGSVNRFLSQTIFKAKEESKLHIDQLKEESHSLYNQIVQYNRKNLSKAEKEQKKVLERKLRLKQREISDEDNKMNKQSLTLNDLVNARKLINNKIHVQGGSIGTNNALEKKHIEAASDILEKQIEAMSSPEALDALEAARKSSKNSFDTFGHNLSGKNLGVDTDVSGKVIKENEIGAIHEFEKELLSNNPTIAMEKFKKYSALLGKDSEAIKQTKRVYAEKVLGLDVSEMTTVKGLESLKFDPEKIRQGLDKALGTESSRKLAKEMFGEQGFHDLVALRKLDDLVKSKLPEGKTSWIKEATAAYDKSLVGLLTGTLKLIKSATWDVAAYPLRDKGRMANRQIIKRLSKELEGKGMITTAKENRIRAAITETTERVEETN